jgi:arylsulfatase
MKKEKKQYIDGVNNVDYWTGKAPESARNDFFYYYESKLTAVRVGPWKLHFSTKEDYYGRLTPRTSRSCSTCAAIRSRATTARTRTAICCQRVSWLKVR